MGIVGADRVGESVRELVVLLLTSDFTLILTPNLAGPSVKSHDLRILGKWRQFPNPISCRGLLG